MFQDDDDKVQNGLTNGFQTLNTDELNVEDNDDTFQERSRIRNPDGYNLIVKVFFVLRLFL